MRLLSRRLSYTYYNIYLCSMQALRSVVSNFHMSFFSFPRSRGTNITRFSNLRYDAHPWIQRIWKLGRQIIESSLMTSIQGQFFFLSRAIFFCFPSQVFNRQNNNRYIGSRECARTLEARGLYIYNRRALL